MNGNIPEYSMWYISQRPDLVLYYINYTLGVLVVGLSGDLVVETALILAEDGASASRDSSTTGSTPRVNGSISDLVLIPEELFDHRYR
ncbi:hypothetical protein GCM10009037_25440 [Halarchaeum grantii]|uniref:Uncharacterized protein n=1 Tax=Halarchaeum grantii TaxID=1193105 RepID=A0A830EY09_9EURY|nr:hypothetical protein GCM10009037_25440 [Halarchaeum grantii]